MYIKQSSIKFNKKENQENIKNDKIEKPFRMV